MVSIPPVSYYVSRNAIHESIVATELPLTSDNVYSEIQKDLVRPVLIASLMARDTCYHAKNEDRNGFSASTTRPGSRAFETRAAQGALG